MFLRVLSGALLLLGATVASAAVSEIPKVMSSETKECVACHKKK